MSPIDLIQNIPALDQSCTRREYTHPAGTIVHVTGWRPRWLAISELGVVVGTYRTRLEAVRALDALDVEDEE